MTVNQHHRQTLPVPLSAITARACLYKAGDSVNHTLVTMHGVKTAAKETTKQGDRNMRLHVASSLWSQQGGQWQ